MMKMFLFILLCLHSHLVYSHNVNQSLPVTYTFTVYTGDRALAETTSCIYVQLFGTRASSVSANLNSCTRFQSGSIRQFSLSFSASVGYPLVILVTSKPFLGMDNQWFCDKISLSTPEGDTHLFPAYRWLDSHTRLTLRHAAAKLQFQDATIVTYNQRRRELEKSCRQFKWCVFQEDFPHTVCAEETWDLPLEVQFPSAKTIAFFQISAERRALYMKKGLANSSKRWDSFLEMEQIVPRQRSQIHEYVLQHWKEDEFFGYQFLNGMNPLVIQRCSKLPENFPVTDEMVKASLNGSSLEHEMKNGTIFLADYKILDGLVGNVIHGRQQYVPAPLVLLHSNPEGLMMPIAIQLKQEAGEENPIFLPTDAEYDWLLAKIFVRNADFIVHEIEFHLIKVHALAEVYTMATVRNLPTMHPLFKLLIPHTEDTLNINVIGRNRLLSKSGVYNTASGVGGESLPKLFGRSSAALTYSSLCLPCDISERGLEDVPNYYYRDDGMRLWNIINKFVKGVLKHYYLSDHYVQRDSELQMWISEIFTEGFQENPSTGIPHNFTTVTDLIKFVTMIIFTVSGQHSAVHTGQVDYGSWIPNSPPSLNKPPPKIKGQTTEGTILETLTDQASSVSVNTVLEMLVNDYGQQPLGHFSQEWFGEEVPRKLIRDFQHDLGELSNLIGRRNARLKVPYTYLDPKNVHNSVSS